MSYTALHSLANKVCISLVALSINDQLVALMAPRGFENTAGMLGIWIGEMIRRRINQETFRKVMLLALFVIGINLIRRAII